MSEQIQKLLLIFGAAMVGLIALLFALQVGFGSLADEEPQLINPQSLLVAALFASGIAIVFGSMPVTTTDRATDRRFRHSPSLDTARSEARR